MNAAAGTLPRAGRNLFRFPAGINLSTALGVSLFVHVIVLSIHFTPPDLVETVREKALDVILVNSKSARKPQKAQAKAQTNLDGGGNTEEDRRAKTPLPPSATTKEGNDLIDAQRRVAELELLQQQMLINVRSTASVNPDQARNTPTPDPAPAVSGVDMARSAMAIARIEGQIARQLEDYNQRPRKKFIGARVQEVAYAQYVEDWRQKIERIGNLNYPDSARGRLYGSLLLSVEIKSTGELLKVELTRSSGKKLLDDAAIRIVQLAGSGGFAPFPEKMRRENDILVISRTWSFTNADQLHAD